MPHLARIMNPISIIALFAGLSEASATAVLPYLNNEDRHVYVWFLIVFPSSLVVMFFLTINLNRKALYPPYRSVNPDFPIVGVLFCRRCNEPVGTACTPYNPIDDFDRPHSESQRRRNGHRTSNRFRIVGKLVQESHISSVWKRRH
ncbi:hypothetical protein [Pseudomonas viridiflava]|uniref:hypothetical protein n=1 Tax=Pseudomonas viridiflava TaxID=33069 RepID=UPI002EA33B09|nr:hypothetical protein [Pseudomonas viridiflava]